MVKRKPNIDDPVFQAGYRAGHEDATKNILTYLQKRYEDRQVVRGSTLGRAILEVAAAMAVWIKAGADIEKIKPVEESTLNGN